jgi:hypothetical protein
MKKLVVVLLLLGFITPLFADDALMIPQNVVRFRVIPSATFQSKVFDDDGSREDNPAYDSAQIYNLSFALEYGVTDWITAALQWTPGWRFASSFSGVNDITGDTLRGNLPALPSIQNQVPDNTDISSTGLNDLFIGAKLQIVGENAPVVSESHRFAFATGVVAPISTYDADAEGKSYLDGDEFQPQRVDEDTLGIGARFYYDYIVNQSFFVNLYNETIFYIPRDLETMSFDVDGTTLVSEPSEAEYDYGYKATFELEPQYQTMLSDDLRLGLGLPVTFVTRPELEIDGEGQENESYVLSVGPNISFFLLGAPWPIDLELQFSTPVIGKNADVSNTVVLQIKNYLRFW